ncbi:MAG: hypothetical protein ABSH20_29505 [Tepidisphaeraceae bacterium]
MRHELLEDWRRRLAELRELLAATPEHESAWLLTIKYEILAYLLHRYAGDVVPPLVSPRRVPAEPVVVSEPAADPPPRNLSVPSGMGKAPRSGEAIRGRLAAISSQNQERYVLHEREIAAQKAEDERILASHVQWLLQQLQKVDKLKLPAPLPDTDGEITQEILENGRQQARRELKTKIQRQLASLGVQLQAEMQGLCDALTQVIDDEESKTILEYSREPQA